MAIAKRYKTKAYYPRDIGVSRLKVAVFLSAGLSVGLLLGYIFMGTAHAVLEIGASNHHGQGPRRKGLEHQTESSTLSAETNTHQTTSTKSSSSSASGVKSQQGWPLTGDTVHVLITSNGSPYLNFQTRIMYATFKLAQKMPGGEKMVGFTRILHKTLDDDLMDEVPTFRADPLHPECDGWCDFPVADRPNAVQQFLDAAKQDPSMIKAPWLLMAETDYVMVKPFQPPLAEDASQPSIAFPFGYIVPTYPTIEGVMRKYFPEEKGPLTKVPNSGPAPCLMRVDQWYKVTPEWERITAEIEADEEAKEKFGWVREMYAFSIAAALEGIELDLQLPPENRLMVQPPADHNLGKAVFMHYTWATLIHDKLSGTEIWRFEKRDFTGPEHVGKIKKLPEPPEFQPGKWQLLDKVEVDRDMYDVVKLMVTTMNKAIDTLQPLDE